MSNVKSFDVGSVPLPPSSLTFPGIADAMSPRVSLALKSATVEIKASLLERMGPVQGRLLWFTLAPALAVLSRRAVLIIVIRIVLEIATGIFAPYLLPFVAAILQLLNLVPGFQDDENKKAYVDAIVGLLQTPRHSMSAPAVVGLEMPIQEIHSDD